MSFLWSFFGKRKNDEDWESVLSELASDIQKREVKLSEIRLRERRSTLLATLYTLAGWMVYLALWYLGALPKHSNNSRTRGVQKVIQAAPVLVGPIIILFIRRIVQVWYARKGDAEEKTLQHLRKQQRTKVEEIKKKTNYYSTRDLLQRYDEPPNSSGLRQRVVKGPGPSSPLQPITPQRPVVNTPGSAQTTALKPMPPSTIPPQKKWYDKVADALLGDEDQAPTASASRYALICQKCFSHNGLVKESMWADTQYVCPKCGHFNSSPNSRKRGASQLSSPASTSSPSPHRPSPHRVPLPESEGSPEPVDSSENDPPHTNMMGVDQS